MTRRLGLGNSVVMLLLALLLAGTHGWAQDAPSPRVGVLLYGGLNVHAASFAALPSVPCCSPGFTGSTTVGASGGLVYEHPVSSNILLSGRLRYGAMGSEMTVDEPRTVHLFGAPVPGLFRHTLQTTMQGVTLDALVGYQPVERLTLLAGPSATVVLSPTYEQTEAILEPAVGGFDVAGQQRVRVLGRGTMPGISTLNFGVTLGASYSMVLHERLGITMAPEISATVGLHNLVDVAADGGSWRMHALRAGVVLTYDLGRRVRQDADDADDDFEGLEASVVATAVLADGREAPLTSIRLEESVTTRSKPLLPAIFFDEKRVVLAERYVQRTAATAQAFDEQQLHERSVLAAYYDMLNVVGRRMQARPTASVRVTGVVPNGGSERGRRDIGAGRAYTVKDYLITTWKISASRIKAGFRDIDVDSARLTDQAYLAELRRVELESDDAELLADVWTTDTTWTSDPAAVRLAPLVRSSEDITSWSLRLVQDSLASHTWQGEDEIPTAIDWDIAGLQPVQPWQTGQVQVLLRVTNDDDATVDAETSPIPITVRSMASKLEQGGKGTRTDRHTFVGFDVASATPTAAHRRTAERLRAAIATATAVRINGYSDASGDAGYNRTVSQQRAAAVAALLASGTASVTGHGATVRRYDETTPEGRFYARSVEVDIVRVQ